MNLFESLFIVKIFLISSCLSKIFSYLCSSVKISSMYWHQFWNTFFEGEILKCLHVLKCIFWGSNYSNFWMMAADQCNCCFMLAWLLISVAATVYFAAFLSELTLLLLNYFYLFTSTHKTLWPNHQDKWLLTHETFKNSGSKPVRGRFHGWGTLTSQKGLGV